MAKPFCEVGLLHGGVAVGSLLRMRVGTLANVRSLVRSFVGLHPGSTGRRRRDRPALDALR